MQSPTNPNPNPQPRSYPPYQPPITPEEIAREQERIRVLLDINSELLEHVNQLQVDGQGGTLPGPTPTQDKAASFDYVACLRATQVNVAYLAVAIQGGGAPKNRGTIGPLIMESPVSSASMLSKYEALRNLFPGWRGSQAGARPQPNNTPPQNVQGHTPQMQGQRPAPQQQTQPVSQGQNFHQQQQQFYDPNQSAN